MVILFVCMLFSFFLNPYLTATAEGKSPSVRALVDPHLVGEEPKDKTGDNTPASDCSFFIQAAQELPHLLPFAPVHAVACKQGHMLVLLGSYIN